MELNIINKKDNALLSRVEINATVDFFNEGTPKKEDIKKKFVSIEKADEKVVVIKKISGSFGSGKADVLAYVYKSEEILKSIEPKKKEKKKAVGAEDAKPVEKAAPKKEEAKEAPKEEAK